MHLSLSHKNAAGEHDVTQYALDDEYTLAWINELIEALIEGRDIEILDQTGTKHPIKAAGFTAAKVEE